MSAALECKSLARSQVGISKASETKCWVFYLYRTVYGFMQSGYSVCSHLSSGMTVVYFSDILIHAPCCHTLWRPGDAEGFPFHRASQLLTGHEKSLKPTSCFLRVAKLISSSPLPFLENLWLTRNPEWRPSPPIKCQRWRMRVMYGASSPIFALIPNNRLLLTVTFEAPRRQKLRINRNTTQKAH